VPKVTTHSLCLECIANLKLPIDAFYRESRSGVNIAKRNITAMHSRHKLRVVTFGTKRRRSLRNVCNHDRSMEWSGVKCFHCTHVFDLNTNLKGERLWHTGMYSSIRSESRRPVTRIILRPLSALSLDEGLISPCDEHASVTLWKREPINVFTVPTCLTLILI
jgi:hypothetical protein